MLTFLAAFAQPAFAEEPAEAPASETAPSGAAAPAAPTEAPPAPAEGASAAAPAAATAPAPAPTATPAPEPPTATPAPATSAASTASVPAKVPDLDTPSWKWDISAEIAWIGATDPAWDFFSEGDSLVSYGLRVGYALTPNVSVLVGWQHAAHGSSTSGPAAGAALLGDEGGDDYPYYEREQAFWAAMYTDQISVGAKGGATVWKWLYPYGTFKLVGLRGLARLDDDPFDDENVTQIEVAGLTGGFSAAAGFDIVVPVRGNVSMAPYVELGYGLLAPMRFEQLGTVQFSGFSGRAGLGVRF